MRAALTGLLVNAALVVVKLLAGLLGHSYALVADAIESSTDIFSSLIVWAGLRITTRPADEDYPYGYGKAETLAAAVVSLMLLGAAMVAGNRYEVAEVARWASYPDGLEAELIAHFYGPDVRVMVGEVLELLEEQRL